MKFDRFLLAVSGFLFLTLPAFAAETPRIVPQGQPQVTLSFAPVAKKASPAVVNIYTRKLVSQRLFSPFMNDPLFQQFFGALPEGQTRQRLENALGSGVLVRSDGLIVTSNHVIAGADEITVVLSDKREFEAKLLAADESADLAVLKIDTKGETLPFLELKDSDDVEVGDLVLAIGNPFGVGQTVTSGIISALARTTSDNPDAGTYIQTDAAINPGNSGGALVTMDGKLVGINAAIYSKSGGTMGIGFAVPSNMVRSIIEAVAMGKKTVSRPWTGIDGQEITSELATSLGLARPSGVLVNEVHSASPARAEGLKIGDVILSVNGKSIDDPAGFHYRIATMKIGEDITLGLLRKGQKAEVRFRLIAPPEDPPRDETLVHGKNPLSGATLANLSPAVSEEYGLHGAERGVVVLKMGDNSAAANLGFHVGDIIAKINGQEIVSVRDALAALEGRIGGWRMLIQREGETINMMIGR
jgi:serine protease Do